MIFVDTNYFLRFLLKDIDRQHEIAKQLFKDGALGKVKLFTSVVVFFEIYWVLSSFYEKDKPALVRILKEILKMEFIGIERKEILEKAVGVFAESNLDLEDSFNLVYAKKFGASEFKTFDQNLAAKFKVGKRGK